MSEEVFSAESPKTLLSGSSEASCSVAEAELTVKLEALAEEYKVNNANAITSKTQAIMAITIGFDSLHKFNLSKMFSLYSSSNMDIPINVFLL
jgi:hypothetical protein